MGKLIQNRSDLQGYYVLRHSTQWGVQLVQIRQSLSKVKYLIFLYKGTMYMLNHSIINIYKTSKMHQIAPF